MTDPGHVDDVLARRERRARQRAELADARGYGLAARYAAKAARLTEAPATIALPEATWQAIDGAAAQIGLSWVDLVHRACQSHIDAGHGGVPNHTGRPGVTDLDA